MVLGSGDSTRHVRVLGRVDTMTHDSVTHDPATVISLLAFDLDAPRQMLVAAWICAGFTILSAIAYAGVFLGAMRSGRHVAP